MAMSNSSAHRGPDDSGFYSNNNDQIYLVHRRLSIQDLSSNGAQPMSSPSGRYVICFNGEIYNHFDIRKILNVDLLKAHLIPKHYW